MIFKLFVSIWRPLSIYLSIARLFLTVQTWCSGSGSESGNMSSFTSKPTGEDPEGSGPSKNQGFGRVQTPVIEGSTPAKVSGPKDS